MAVLSASDLLRFWSKVQKTDSCWLWKPSLNSKRYGKFSCGKNYQITPHRLSWEIHNSPIPESMQVLHRCDVPYCVNPDHLFLGTQADNIHDKLVKGRCASGKNNGRHTKPESTPRGEDHVCAVLTEEQVIEIRLALIEKRALQRELAVQYGVSKSTIGAIAVGRNWKHL